MSNAKTTLAKYAVALLIATLCGGAQAAGSFSVLYGQKSLNSEWDPFDSQTEFGFGIAFKQSQWPVSVVGSYLSSSDSLSESGDGFLGNNFVTIKQEIEASTEEVGLGIRKYLSEEQAKFFIEAGLASISGKLKNTVSANGQVVISESISDSAMGFWFGAGVDMKVADAVSVGMAVRLSNATLTFSATDPDTGEEISEDFKGGGTHFNVYAAYHFQ